VWEDNEDRILTKAGRLFMVADGMGGQDGGEIAAQSCKEILSELFDLMRVAPEAAVGDLADAVKVANESVYRQNIARGALNQRGPDGRPMTMGTTCSACLVVPSELGCQLVIAHVGDSRIYRLRAGVIAQLTEDHNATSFIGDRLVVHGNVLTRAVGTHPFVEVDVDVVDLEAGDVFLVCSDGLHGCVSDRAMHAVLKVHGPGQAVGELIAMALDGGGTDNISVIAFKVDKVEGT
jgi:protein phosphatase